MAKDSWAFTGFHDKNKYPLYVGDRVYTQDKTGKRWVGTIIETNVLFHNGNKKTCFAFQSNYQTLIHDQDYADTLTRSHIHLQRKTRFEILKESTHSSIG